MDELHELYQHIITEKIQKADITRLASKSDNINDIEKLLGTDPIKFLKTLINKEKLNTVITEYLKMKGVNNSDPDVQLLATSLATIITKVKTVDAKILKDFPNTKK